METIAPMLPLIGSIFFVAVIGVVGMLVYRSMSGGVSDERIAQVIGSTAADERSKRSQQMLEDVEKRVSKSKSGEKYARDLARADVKMKVYEFFAIKVVAGILGFFVLMFLARSAPPLGALLAGGVGAFVFSFLPDVYLSNRASARIKAFNNQLGDTITMMANALRGGYSFMQTIDLVSKEAPSPTAEEFRRLVQEVGIGRSTEEALANLLRRMPSEDLDLLITAVNIQHEVGGNLAQILDSIGHTIRERVRIQGEIKTLTAQGRISAYIIVGLPVALGGYIQAVNPEYMAPMFTFGMPPEAWCCMPVTAVVMMMIGYWAIMKIVTIEV